jgi:TP901 family phage tail tape measure protein
MARLEIELAGVNSDLKRVLKESKIELSNFSKGLDFKTKGVTRVNDTLKATKSILTDIIAQSKQANTAISAMNGKGLGTTLANEKIALAAARTEAQNYKNEALRLANQLKDLKNQQANLNTVTAQGKIDAQNYRTEQARLNAESAKLRLAQQQNRQSTVAASGSYKEAQQSLTALGQAIRNTKGGFTSTDPAIKKQIANYRELNSKLKAFDAQLGNHQRNVGNYRSALQGLGNLATTYFGFTALLAGGRAVLMNNAKISDSLADVRRTAGLTAKEADSLAQALKGIDTRTNLADLLGIATIGGQLGIAKDQLGGFTQAIDQLAVSLGGELQGGAEGIAKSLGVLDNVFGVTATAAGDVNKAYNQIGSAILALGQEGLATGDFLADFSERVGGIAKQAGIGLPTVLAFGAVLQENGVSAEVAGTSFKRLISALSVNSAKFFQVAKFGDANLTLKEFNTLVNTDTKRALDLLLNGLRKGGDSTIAFNSILKDLRISGSGLSQTIAALVTGQDNLNKYVAIGTEEFNKATLAGDQFAIKNETLAASMDKLVNLFANASTSGVIGNFFKGIIDYVRVSLSEFNNLVNSSSWKEFWSKLSSNSSSAFDLNKTFASNSRKTNANQAFLFPTGGSQDGLEAKLKGKGERFNRDYLTKLQKTMEEAEGINRKYNEDVKSGLLKANKDQERAYNENYQKAKSYYEDVAAIQKKLGFAPKVKPTPARVDSGAPAGFGGGGKKSGSGVARDYEDELAQIAAKTMGFDSLMLAEGVEASNEKTRQKYAKLADDLDGIQKAYTAKYKGNTAKIADLDRQTAATRKLLQINSENELTQNALDHQEKKADIIAGIEDKAGVVRETSLARELQLNDVHYKELERKYKDHADILEAITRARVASDEQINDKWRQKRIEAETKITSGIEDLMQKGFTDNVNGSAKANAKIDQQLAERLAKVRDYYAELKKMAGGNGFGLLGLGVAEAVTTSGIKGQAAQAKNPVAEQAKEQLREAVSSFGGDMINTLRNINSQADRSFGAIVGSLGESLSGMLNSVFDQQLKGILKNLVDGTKVSTAQAISAIASAAGGLISGATKKTSYVGQGLGGAVSGAGAGAGLGATIGVAGGPAGVAAGAIAGAVIGGTIGLLSGLFGAGKARKQEKLEQQQLAEQQKQTALMERTNALAYASQIIGRQTTNGVVTAVEVNEFGELKTKISGSDIDVIWKRSNNKRSRGV